MTGKKQQSDVTTENIPAKILIVKDNTAETELIKKLIEKSELRDSRIVGEFTLAGAISALDETHFDVVLLDLNLWDSEGLQTLESLFAVHPKANVIVFTDWENRIIGMHAWWLGAQDYLIREHFDADYLARILGSAIERSELAIELEKGLKQITRQLNRRLPSSPFEADSLVPLPETPPPTSRSQRLEIPDSDRAERIQRHIRKSDL